MQGYKCSVVNDPRKAHLFNVPFSSRMLEYTLYVRNSHNRTNLRQILKEYSEKIAAKYPYWNRTGGADHFLVACHDWGCVSSETYVRSATNPLRDLGGKPPSQRQILAFYAGNVHGYLRPILIEHWKDKDPDMKIFGPMPPGVAIKMNYIQHTKRSKYCICPKSYEGNSRRAPYETRHHMERCIKALCNDDVTGGFKIGRDVSLRETYVRSARNPLRHLGGKPPSQRQILSFYAGNVHGYLRPILIEHWKDKDPDMKIFGPMPPGVAIKMNYIQHMKRSK
ncbi:unnamed protein product [Prunus armeniaca]|uniref:Exostosin GT47 domain-containing protein n=1 Tax=Prunus armeniaca TaxID=36596 RepID=A0A6J5Y2J5_PRUAR|nr:unnamed protein product [Prunus armeniaca]